MRGLYLLVAYGAYIVSALRLNATTCLSPLERISACGETGIVAVVGNGGVAPWTEQLANETCVVALNNFFNKNRAREAVAVEHVRSIVSYHGARFGWTPTGLPICPIVWSTLEPRQPLASFMFRALRRRGYNITFQESEDGVRRADPPLQGRGRPDTLNRFLRQAGLPRNAAVLGRTEPFFPGCQTCRGRPCFFGSSRNGPSTGGIVLEFLQFQEWVTELHVYGMALLPRARHGHVDLTYPDITAGCCRKCKFFRPMRLSYHGD